MSLSEAISKKNGSPKTDAGGAQVLRELNKVGVFNRQNGASANDDDDEDPFKGEHPRLLEIVKGEVLGYDFGLD